MPQAIARSTATWHSRPAAGGDVGDALHHRLGAAGVNDGRFSGEEHGHWLRSSYCHLPAACCYRGTCSSACVMNPRKPYEPSSVEMTAGTPWRANSAMLGSGLEIVGAGRRRVGGDRERQEVAGQRAEKTTACGRRAGRRISRQGRSSAGCRRRRRQAAQASAARGRAKRLPSGPSMLDGVAARQLREPIGPDADDAVDNIEFDAVRAYRDGPRGRTAAAASPAATSTRGRSCRVGGRVPNRIRFRDCSRSRDCGRRVE